MLIDAPSQDYDTARCYVFMPKGAVVKNRYGIDEFVTCTLSDLVCEGDSGRDYLSFDIATSLI